LEQKAISDFDNDGIADLLLEVRRRMDAENYQSCYGTGGPKILSIA
jgi:hypothetical protein